MWIGKHKIKESNEPIISSQLKLLSDMSTSQATLAASVSKLNVQIKSISRIVDHIILSMVLEMTQEFNSLKAITL